MVTGVAETSETITLPLRSREVSDLYHYIQKFDGHRDNEKCRQVLSLLIDFAERLPCEMLQGKPELATAYHLMADAHIRFGEVSTAADLYQRGLQKFPASGDLLLGYGECLTRLYRFDEAEEVLIRLNGDVVSPEGMHTYRKKTALGELYQRREMLEEARVYYDAALNYRSDWIPAHIGLIELEVITCHIGKAEESLGKIIKKLGPDPRLLLLLANIALILSKAEAAQEIASRIGGKLLEDDRFEYFLFQLDFFKGDRDSLVQVPYFISGETVESEAARVWLMSLTGRAYQADPARIPENIWREEYLALDQAWHEITVRR